MNQREILDFQNEYVGAMKLSLAVQRTILSKHPDFFPLIINEIINEEIKLLYNEKYEQEQLVLKARELLNQNIFHE